jgi:hypothetical protein
MVLRLWTASRKASALAVDAPAPGACASAGWGCDSGFGCVDSVLAALGGAWTADESPFFVLLRNLLNIFVESR